MRLSKAIQWLSEMKDLSGDIELYCAKDLGNEFEFLPTEALSLIKSEGDGKHFCTFLSQEMVDGFEMAACEDVH